MNACVPLWIVVTWLFVLLAYALFALWQMTKDQ
jgi:hypothetical protein